MNYPDIFKKLIDSFPYSFIGTGNPSSKILIVGKEVATDVELGVNQILEKQNHANYNKNAFDWKLNIKGDIKQADVKNWIFDDPKLVNNPLYAFKGAEIKEEGKTWRKYQKLHDYIFPDNKCDTKYGHNFQERIFITEMSELNSKFTKKAQKKKEFNDALKSRKNNFFSHEYFDSFSVIILACSNYINGSEIENIFDVKFAKQKGYNKQLYWTHFNERQLVIHTRQLSCNVSNNLLIGIADDIRKHMYNCIKAHNSKYIS